MILNKLYLAGPSVFRKDSIEYGNYLKKTCLKYGLIGLYPMDNEIKEYGKYNTAFNIRIANEKMMKECNGAIADMSPFRGPGMDGGTSYEIGYLSALGKTVVAYSDDARSYKDKISCRYENGILLDLQEMVVENFDLQDNLMMSTYVGDILNNAESAIRKFASLYEIN